jgi:hypothetical protein
MNGYKGGFLSLKNNVMGPSYQLVLKFCECIQIVDKAMYMSVNDKIKYATS